MSRYISDQEILNELFWIERNTQAIDRDLQELHTSQTRLDERVKGLWAEIRARQDSTEPKGFVTAELHREGRSRHAPDNVCGAVTDSGAGDTWCAQPPLHKGPCKLA